MTVNLEWKHDAKKQAEDSQLIDALCYAVNVDSPEKLHARVKQLVDIAKDSRIVDAEEIIERLEWWLSE